MTHKEKAKELVDSFRQYFYGFGISAEQQIEQATQCALICVKEIISVAKGSDDADHINWWEEVKTEIEKL